MMTIQTSTATNATATPAATGPDAVLLALAPGDAGAPDTDGAPAALFAQLLNQADLAAPADPALADALAAADAAITDADQPSDSSTDAAAAVPVAATPADTAALPVMVSSLLVMAMPPLAAVLAAPAPAAAAAGSGAPAANSRVDALGASPANALGSGAVLNPSGTRLNLAAAGVAVMPAAAPLAAATTAPASTTAAASYAAAADVAAQGAIANGLSPAPTPAPAATLITAGAAHAATAAGAIAANAAALASGAVPIAQPVPRSPLRGDDGSPANGSGSAGSGTTATTTTASATPLGASTDDSVIGAARVSAAPTPSGVNGSYAQTAQQLQNNGAAVKLAGTPEQWQQPLREALGDRLQLQLQRNDNQAVIRLDPPNMGRIEIEIRHTAGSLQVNLSASNSEVLRQLNSIGDNVRQDLSQRQFNDVAVTVSAARAGQGQADADGRSRQQRDADEGRTPGRALSDDSSAASSFAMLTERE